MKINKNKKYDKYKDSGIEWIGKIPESWDIRKIKTLSNICGRIGFKGYTIEDIVEPETRGAAIVLGGTNIMKEGYISFDKLTYISEFKYLESPEIMLQGGEILITKVGAGTGDNAIYIKYQDRVTINPNVMLCKPTNNVISKYLNYFLLSPTVKQEIYLESNKSGAQPAINQQFIKNLIVAYPSMEEQQQIADYLDKKCGEIDRVVDVQKEVIEKLKEYKQSVITAAVTKGLDKSVPPKDSGTEWIGKIPEHWGICKIKHCVIFNPNYSEDLEKNTPVSFAPMECLTNAHLECKETTVEKVSSSYTYFAEGDVIMAKVTPCFENGNIAIAKNLLNQIGFGTSELYVFRVKSINNKFLLYFLQNRIFKDLAISTMYGTGGLKRVSADFVKNYKFALPTLVEQQQIADFLEQKCSEIDKIIEDKEKLIEKLVEYKKSLIYECVTGKRKEIC